MFKIYESANRAVVVQRENFELQDKALGMSKDIANFINAHCDFSEDINFSLDKFTYDYAMDVCKRINAL